MTANVLDGHIHQFSLLICCTLCMRCVSSDENCLPPTAPTEADVSFFSTLGCSLQGALTTGSMALALLSPFIWSERVLAPVLVCRWPSFHLASPIPPPPRAPLTAGCHSHQQTDDKSLGSTCTRCLYVHVQSCGKAPRCIWIPLCTFFFLPTFLLLKCFSFPSGSNTLTGCLGFPASSSGLWSQEGADHPLGGEPAVGQSGSDVSMLPSSNM